MRVYTVSYDLRGKSRPDYKGLFAELQASPNWWHYLESTWLVLTNETSNELWARLAPHVHQLDSLLIIEVRDNASGWLPKAAWNWIGAYVPLPETVLG